jgi:hypothetical protein
VPGVNLSAGMRTLFSVVASMRLPAVSGTRVSEASNRTLQDRVLNEISRSSPDCT